MRRKYIINVANVVGVFLNTHNSFPWAVVFAVKSRIQPSTGALNTTQPMRLGHCADVDLLNVVNLHACSLHWANPGYQNIIMSPLRRHIFVCFMAKSAFLGEGGFGPSSVKRGRTHIQGGPKKVSQRSLHITTSNTVRFSKFFHCHILMEIWNKAVIKYPTSPQTCCHTTLWNTYVSKLVRPDHWNVTSFRFTKLKYNEYF